MAKSWFIRLIKMSCCMSPLVFFVGAANANPDRKNPDHYINGKLVIYSHYSPPWSFKQCYGAEIDIIKLAFKEVGIAVHCYSVSYARLVKLFLSS